MGQGPGDTRQGPDDTRQGPDDTRQGPDDTTAAASRGVTAAGEAAAERGAPAEPGATVERGGPSPEPADDSAAGSKASAGAPALSSERETLARRRQRRLLRGIGLTLALMVAAAVAFAWARSSRQAPEAPTCCALRQVCDVCDCSTMKQQVAVKNDEKMCRELSRGFLGCTQRSFREAERTCRSLE